MPSILSLYQEQIIDALENKGFTYKRVSDDLAEVGVKISSQSVHSWYTRLQKKIRTRKIASISSSCGSRDNSKSESNLSTVASGTMDTEIKKSEERPLGKTLANSIESALEEQSRRNAARSFFFESTLTPTTRRHFSSEKY